MMIARANASKTNLDTRTYVQYNTLSLVAQPQHHLRRRARRFVVYRRVLMRLPTTRCDQRGLDPTPPTCDGRGCLLLYAAGSNAFFAAQQRVWGPAARSQPPSPRQISKNIRSYWIWKAASKIVAYATKCAVSSVGITLCRTIAAQIVAYATKCAVPAAGITLRQTAAAQIVVYATNFVTSG
jgi:hypothetical protein